MEGDGGRKKGSLMVVNLNTTGVMLEITSCAMGSIAGIQLNRWVLVQNPAPSMAVWNTIFADCFLAAA